MTLSQQIQEYALQLGFDACGYSRAESIGDEIKNVRTWLDKGYHGEMEYLARNIEKRCDPTLLVDNAKSIISLALNYYPHHFQESTAPQFAYYAYGKDYHDVMKVKMQDLFNFIQSLVPEMTGRVFCDTAPVLERYWAAKSGIGFIGKNTLLIIPRKGSFFFLGELIIDIELDYGKPLDLSCGNCTRCLEACPTNALEAPHLLNANKCISYQTIENKGDIDPLIVDKLDDRIYGCDICQQVCPWNRYARPHKTEEFNPSSSFLTLTVDRIKSLSVEDYQQLFKGSAIKRAKLSGLKRNAEALKKSSLNNSKQSSL